MLVQPRAWPVSAVLLVLVLALPVPGAGPPKGAKPAIRAELRFTVKVFDPKGTKKGRLECVVHNDTGSPIMVPTRYARRFDSDIVVFGHGATTFRREMRLVQREKAGEEAKATFAEVGPGKSLVVFEGDLRELLVERKKSGWDWQA
jgi:hypothetical protein